jgi:transcriptional regulator with XRE-family HTH domain
MLNKVRITKMSKLREERLKKNWKQLDLAYRSRISQAEISRIECGRLIPTQGQLQRLAKALGVRPDELAQA